MYSALLKRIQLQLSSRKRTEKQQIFQKSKKHPKLDLYN